MEIAGRLRIEPTEIVVYISKLSEIILAISYYQRVYDGLHTIVGPGRISRFIESLVRPYVVGKDLEIAYEDMARDEAREAEALEWAEATVGDVSDEPR